MFNTRRGLFGAPPVVRNLLMVNVVLWLVTWASQYFRMPALDNALGYLALYPADSPYFHSWQVVTYMFMHAGWTHILFNMFTLWMFGRFIETDLGSRRFLVYYMVCGIGAGLVQLLVNHLTGGTYPTVGASGAIYGLLLAFGMLHPNDIIMPLIPPIPMKAKWAVAIFGALELLMGLGAVAHDNVAHFAHLGGLLWGLILLLYWLRRGKIYRR